MSIYDYERAQNLAKRAYLGDGAYIGHDTEAGELVITTENGIEVGNVVILEETAARALVRYLKTHFPRLT